MIPVLFGKRLKFVAISVDEDMILRRIAMRRPARYQPGEMPRIFFSWIGLGCRIVLSNRLGRVDLPGEKQDLRVAN
jgi:hypothetical protein